jgi:tRNA-2-methylthio-N6-dimethylallyladenosine synthase
MSAALKTAKEKKLHIMTWGCQMNVYDSARMADLLRPLGYALSDHEEEADLVILNTCHIREKASEKVFSELGRIHARQKKREAKGEHVMIGVAGCVAQAEGQQIMARAPYVNLVFGPQTYHRLPEMVTKALRQGGGVLDTEFPEDSKFDALPTDQAGQGVSAFLSIQEGCDKFCTFCVVPYTRGAEYSRDGAGILAEAQRLIDKGAQEITLLGQNVNAWHGAAPDGGTWNLAALIHAVSKLKGVARIRYTTSHPRDMDDALIEAHRDVPQLMPFLHLPVQSGSDVILTAMNRQHSSDAYRQLIDKFREHRSDIAFSSDFIVGFPGETDKDFEATLKLVRDVNYAQAYSFKYSARPGTPASTMARQVEEHVKAERLQTLQDLLFAQQRRFNEAFIGQSVPVLFDRRGKLKGQVLGRSPHMQSVHMNDAAHAFGTIAPAFVTDVTTNSLRARIPHLATAA